MSLGIFKPDRNEETDVAIIGGGIMGCSAALALAEAGLSVILLEARQCGSQASGVNFGGVRRQGRHRTELPLAQRAHAIWQDLGQRIGNRCEFDPIGHLRLARTEADMHLLEQHRIEAEKFGLKPELLSRPTLQQRYPWLSSSLAGGSLLADDGHANPRLVAPWYAAKAKEKGARIYQDTPVRHITYDGIHFHVMSQALRVQSRFLLNTAGAWGAEIAHVIGDDVALTVKYPNMFVTEPLAPFMNHCLGVVRGGFYARQVTRGNVVIGGSYANGNCGLKPARPNPQVSIETLRIAAASVPALHNTTIIRTWTGIEGYIADTLPVLGPSLSIPGAWHAFGFSGHGLQLGPAVGEVLADLVIKGETATPIAPFSLARFKDPTIRTDS